MSMYIGEALVGEGNEIAHIDLLIGDKAGPVDHPDDDRGDHRFALTTSSGVTPLGVV